MRRGNQQVSRLGHWICRNERENRGKRGFGMKILFFTLVKVLLRLVRRCSWEALRGSKKDDVYTREIKLYM